MLRPAASKPSLSRLQGCWWGCVILALTPCAAGEAGVSVPTGDFYREHTIGYFDGERKRESLVIDQLSVRALGGDRLALAIEVYADNGHECRLEGELHRQDQTWAFREAYELDGQSYCCRLLVHPTDDGVVLEDVDHACRLFYCGMRGRLDGLRFERGR